MMRLAVFALSPLLALAACGGSSGGGRVAVDAKGDATTTSDATSTSTATTATDATTSTTTDAATTRPPDATTATTTATDAATTTNPDVTVSCGSVTLAGALTYYEESSPADDYVAFILGDGEDLGFGGELPDLLWIEFYADVDQTGTYDLASAGDNDNYGTCTQCVTVYVDVDDAAGTYDSDLFQTGGTLTVAAGSAPSTQSVSITLTDLGLEEVTIDTESFESTPVAGGACYNAASPVTLATE